MTTEQIIKKGEEQFNKRTEEARVNSVANFVEERTRLEKRIKEINETIKKIAKGEIDFPLSPYNTSVIGGRAGTSY